MTRALMQQNSDPHARHGVAADPWTQLRRKRRLLLGLCLLLVTITVMGGVAYHDFVGWDDDLHVYANRRFQPVTMAHIIEFWGAPYEHLYIPLTYTVWSGVAYVSQLLTPGTLSPGLFHQINLLLHLTSMLVVYRLGQLLLCHCVGRGANGPFLLPQPEGAPDRAPMAAMGTMLFALHPLQVEAVAWVSGLKDVLCGFWGLVALWQYVKYVQGSETSRAWSRYGLATVAYGTALLAKPMAVAVPLMAWGLDTVGLGRSWKQAARSLVLWGLIAVTWAWWTKTLQPNVVLEYVTPWWGRLIVAADAVTFYLRTLVWPVDVVADYGRTPQVVLEQARSYVTTAVMFGLGGMVWWRWRHAWRGLHLALSLFLGGLLPVLGLVPFVFQTYSTVADRYAYLAMLGPALGLAWLLTWGYRRKVLWVVCGAILVLCAWRSMVQVQVWHDTITLFTHTLHHNPHSAVAHNNLGLALAQQGEVDAAIQHYRQALSLRPDFAYTHNNLGLALVQQGKFAAAVAHYKEALRLQPDYLEAHNNLGLAFINQNNIDEAIRQFRQILMVAPDDASTHNHLGIALAAQGQLSEAVQQFGHAIRLKPDNAKAYLNLGLVFVQQERSEEAMRAFRVALQLRPGWPQAARHLAELLATHAASAPAAAREGEGIP